MSPAPDGKRLAISPHPRFAYEHTIATPTGEPRSYLIFYIVVQLRTKIVIALIESAPTSLMFSIALRNVFFFLTRY